MNSNQAAAQKAYILNALALLAVVIPVGAVADQLTSASQVARGLFLFIFSFHMPLLFLLGGALFRRIAGDCGKVWRTVGFLLLAYALMKLLTAIVQQVPFDDGFTISWLSESGMPWVFLGAAFCCVLGWLLRKADGRFVLPAAVVLALACGYTSKVGDFLALSRCVVYFPYFAAGQLLDMDKLEAALREKKARVAGLIVLAAAFLGMMLLADKLYFLRALLTGRNSYGALNERQAWGPVLRIGVYCLGVVLSASVLAVVPRRELGKFVNNLGGRFVQIYFWYRPLLHALTGLGLLKTLEGAAGIAAGRIVWMLLAPACVAALSCRAFRWPLNWAYKAMDAVVRWVENRPRSIGELRQRYGVRALDAKYYDLLSASSGKKRFRVYLVHYTLAFAVAALLVYSPFIVYKKSFIYDPDGIYTDFPFFVYTGQALKSYLRNLLNGSFSVSLFDINISLGEGVLGYIGPFDSFDPLGVVPALVPFQYLEGAYICRALLRLYFAGLSFSALCFYFDKRVTHTLIGSIIYSFSGYAFYFAARQPSWIVALIQFPLLILGLEKILRKEKPYIFILAVFYSGVNEYYHLYMQTIMFSIYGLVRVFSLYGFRNFKQSVVVTVRAVGAYILGLGLSAILLFPAAAQLLSSARSGFSNPNASENTVANINRLRRVIAPTVSGASMTLAALVLFAMVLIYFEKGHRSLKVLVAIAVFALVSRHVGLLMNGFQYAAWRFTFGVTLVLVYATVEMLPELLDLSRKQQFICIAVFLIYATDFFTSKIARSAKTIHLGVIFLALTLLIILVSFKRRDNGSGKELTTIRQYGRSMACLALVIVNVGMNSVYHFVPDQGNSLAVFRPSGEVIHGIENAVEKEVVPYLADNPTGRFDSSSAQIHWSMIWGVPGMPFYNSPSISSIAELWNRIEASDRIQLTRLNSSGQRTEINTLLSEKYHVETPARTAYVPYGYELIETTENGNLIYENQYALPWGYTYDTDQVISYQDMDGLNGLQKQEAMMQAVALDDVADTQLQGVTFDAQRLPYEGEYTNCSWENGTLVVSAANAIITLGFNMPAGVECYVRLAGFNTDDSGQDSFYPTVKCGDVSRMDRVQSAQNLYYFGREDYLFNLGYSDQERHELTITFPNKGTFKLADIELYALPMDNYPAHVEALRAEPMENIQWGTNSLTGTVDLSRDKILCVSVPYSKGWTATVDGEETEILCGNYMFMCIPLTAGHHDIAFHYCTPGLKLGAALTVCSAAILAVMLVRDRKKRGIAR